jgi:hypothetical protein
MENEDANYTEDVAEILDQHEAENFDDALEVL